MAYFYFDFNDTAKQSYSNSLRSIVAQIFAETPQSVLMTYYRDSNRGTKQPEDAALLLILRRMLSQLDAI